jgi:broad specificity phosphatase PhoE
MGSPKLSDIDHPFQKVDNRSRTSTDLSAHSLGSSVTTSASNLETKEVSSSIWKVYPSWQYSKLVARHSKGSVKLIYLVRHAEGTHNVNREYKDIAQLDARLTEKGKDQCRKLRDELLTSHRNSHKTHSNTSINHRQGLHHLLAEISADQTQSSLSSNETSSDVGVCVVTSPMSRCVETAQLSFDFLWSELDDNKHKKTNQRIPFLAHESLRETVNYNCDRRRPISEIAQDFPQVDFSNCIHEEDILWSTLLSIDRYRREHEEGGHLESAALHLVAQRGVEALDFIQKLPHSKVVVCTHSAYLRCVLSWGHPGGVPLMVEQRLDRRKDPARQEKIVDYSCILLEEAKAEGDASISVEQQRLERELRSFEMYMRKDYANAELRSFCLLVDSNIT